MRRFYLNRVEDINGISGTGKVAEGIVFSNGKAVISWLTPYTSVTVFENVDVMMAIHGHEGKTEVVFTDKEHTH